MWASQLVSLSAFQLALVGVCELVKMIACQIFFHFGQEVCISDQPHIKQQINQEGLCLSIHPHHQLICQTFKPKNKKWCIYENIDINTNINWRQYTIIFLIVILTFGISRSHLDAPWPKFWVPKASDNMIGSVLLGERKRPKRFQLFHQVWFVQHFGHNFLWQLLAVFGAGPVRGILKLLGW